MRALRLRCAIVCLLLAIAGVGGAAAEVDLVEVVAKVEKSVARVDTSAGFGSGAIVGDEGLVLTNFHVVDGANDAKITLRSGKVYPVLGYLAVDPGRDLVLLKTDKFDPSSAIAIADQMPRVGEKVAAFGNPKGFSFTTSEGIVSAIRSGDDLINTIGQDAYSHLGYVADAMWIQTTAPISPGNSGGPLVTMDTKLVGLNTWNHVEGQNLNFAISLKDIHRLLAGVGNATTPKRLASLPRVRAKSIRPRFARPDEFKLELPTGRVFSFAIFDAGNANQVSANQDSDMVVIQHANGATYAAASQQMGQLHGVTIAQYDNKEPMVYATYLQGKRHGVLKTWNEAGDPVLFSQYARGRRQGFCCYFDEDSLALVAQYENDQLKYLQFMSGLSTLEGFDTREAAEKNPKAKTLLAKLDATEAMLKKNEAAFRKQVRDSEEARRRALAAQLGPEKRRRIQDRIDQQAQQNAAFFRQLERAATGR